MEVNRLQCTLSPPKSVVKPLPAFTVETVAQSMILRAIVSEFPRERKKVGVEVLLFKCSFPGQPELTESNSLEGSLGRCVFLAKLLINLIKFKSSGLGSGREEWVYIWLLASRRNSWLQSQLA